jgi:hypothetical protein
MYFDGSLMKTGAGAGLLFISPLGKHLRYVLRLHFPASNNVAEYEALVNGLRNAIELGVRRLDARGDSQLVIDQVMKNSHCRSRHQQSEQQHPRRCFRLRRDLARPRTVTRAEGSPPRRRTPALHLGHRSQDLLQGPGPSRHLDQPLRRLSQLSLEDISPAHGLGSVTPRLVPLADDLAKLQSSLLHLLGQGGHVLPGRRSFFSSRLRLCPRRHRCLRFRLIAEQPRVL